MTLPKKTPPEVVYAFLFLLLSATLQTGCTTTASLNSAAPPSLVVDPLSSDDIDVDYTRASVEARRESIAGFMINTAPQDAIQVAILDFQNGNQRGTMNARGINLLVGITGIAYWVSLSRMLHEILATDENSALDNHRAMSAIIGLPIAMYFNERIWQRTNSRRVRAFGQQALMDRNQADFYCLPNEKISFTRRLFRTDWAYSGNMLAGRYSILSQANSVETDELREVDNNHLEETKPRPGSEERLLAEQTLKSETSLDESADEICYVLFKRQWIQGNLKDRGTPEGGDEWFKVSFEDNGKFRTKFFNRSQFSYNLGLRVLDKVMLDGSYGVDEGVVVEIIESLHGQLAKVQFSVGGELKHTTVPAYLLKKKN